ncbi:MAG: MBL fold metallo-hydrolase [bacterium]
MDNPTMLEPYPAAPDIIVLPSYFPLPGLGMLPVNAFVLKAAEPVLVDAGLICLSDAFMENLSSVIEPAHLRWLWLTHADQDHIGSVARVLESAPALRIITTYLGAGRMSLCQPLPTDRVYFLNPGQSISVGDRTLTAVRPPSFDSAETTGFHDPKAGAFFCADCFGAIMSEPAAAAGDIPWADLRAGLIKWATIDAPWLHMVDGARFKGTLDRVRKLSPKLVLSHHLPVARGMADQLLDCLAEVPAAEPFVGPDQQEFEALTRGVGAELRAWRSH